MPDVVFGCRHVQCVKPDHALLSKARTAIEPVIGSFGSGVAANAGVHSSGSSSGGSSGVGPSSAAGTAAARLRRHFAELTAGLLAPFEVYFNPGPSGKVNRGGSGMSSKRDSLCPCTWGVCCRGCAAHAHSAVLHMACIAGCVKLAVCRCGSQNDDQHTSLCCHHHLHGCVVIPALSQQPVPWPWGQMSTSFPVQLSCCCCCCWRSAAGTSLAARCIPCQPGASRPAPRPQRPPVRQRVHSSGNPVRCLYRVTQLCLLVQGAQGTCTAPGGGRGVWQCWQCIHTIN